MNAFKEHIIYKISTVILVIALLTPSFVKFFHVFEVHAHVICKNQQKTHFHELDLDCQFYKFKLKTQFSTLQQTYDLLVIEDNYQYISSCYQLISQNTFSSLSLRGPPQLV